MAVPYHAFRWLDGQCCLSGARPGGAHRPITVGEEASYGLCPRRPERSCRHARGLHRRPARMTRSFPASIVRVDPWRTAGRGVAEGASMPIRSRGTAPIVRVTGVHPKYPRLADRSSQDSMSGADASAEDRRSLLLKSTLMGVVTASRVTMYPRRSHQIPDATVGHRNGAEPGRFSLVSSMRILWRTLLARRAAS